MRKSGDTTLKRRVIHFIPPVLAVLLFVECAAGAGVLTKSEDISLKKEISRTYDNGFKFLTDNQNPDGCWSTPEFPAITGLVLFAFLNNPRYAKMAEKPAFIKRGLAFIVKNVQPDGGIYKEGLPNYNTSVCIMALMAANDPEFYPYILKARHFIVSLQNDKGTKGVADEPFDGGIGYGTKDHPDLSNTYIALESLKMTEALESDQYLQRYKDLQAMKKTELNWDAALQFIQRCQNLPRYNDQAWASDDPKNKGGFVYFPGSSKAGKETLPDGKVALRSYGSMTYAGLLSMIFADLNKDDPRISAAYEWIKKNFTLDENPGMNQQGLYYYYHTLAKALTVYGEDYLTGPDGRMIDWRHELAVKLVELQRSNGSWINDSGRWWENDPVLVTAYALIAMNMIANAAW